MEIIFNRKKSKIMFVILFFIFVAIIIFFASKQVNDNMEDSIVSDNEESIDATQDSFDRKDLNVDTISDIRGLGYPGQRKIAKDSDGNIYVAYRKDIDKYSEIFVARIYKEGEQIQVSGTEKPIAKLGIFDQRVPSISVDKGGTIHAVWYGPDEDNKEKNNRQIKYCRSADRGNSWSEWNNIAQVRGYSYQNEYWQEHPFIKVSKDGTIYVVWEGRDENNNEQQIKFIKSVDGGRSWTQWKNVKEVKGKTQSRPSLAENDKGELFLVMYSSGGNDLGQQQIQVSMSRDRGETWSDWVAVSDPRYDSRHASVAIDSDNIIHVVWRSQSAENIQSRIYYRSFNEEKLSSIKMVSESNNYQFFPNIGIADSKKEKIIFVSWMESKDSSDFPRENPQAGTGFISFFDGNDFQNNISWGDNVIFYPNIPERWDSLDFIPVFYAERNEQNLFDVKLKFFNNIR